MKNRINRQVAIDNVKRERDVEHEIKKRTLKY